MGYNFCMDIGYILTVLGVILVSMTLHEFMHGYVAYLLGDQTAKLSGRLSLNPVHHIDPFLTILLPLVLAISGMPVFGGAKPVQVNPYAVKYGDWGMALVGISGPLTNLLLAFVSFGGYVLAANAGLDVLEGIFTTSVLVNLGFFLFNILPIPPLDGSRVLYAIMPDSLQGYMEKIEQFGIILIFAIVMLMSPVIGTYMTESSRAIIDIFSRLVGVY